MEKSAKKVSRKRRFKKNAFLMIFLIAFAAYIVVAFINQEIKFRELAAQEVRLLQEVERLESEKAELESALKDSESLDNIEKIARSKLKMVKPNEMIYIIQDGEPKE